MKTILLLTDSRGVHKPAGSMHHIYGERLAKTQRIKLTSYRCPYQWTTIPDLLAIADHLGPQEFDHIILHAGIVDHSPRPASQIKEKILNPVDVTPTATVDELMATRDFTRRKIVNRKWDLFESVFGKDALDDHVNHVFQQMYEGENTQNLYSLAMLRFSLLPKLKTYPNLIFVGSNNIVPGWQGDYPRPRPENISVIEDYSKIICDGLEHSIDLSGWNGEQIKRFTCDNIHLSAEGSDWLYLRILENLGMRTRDYTVVRRHARADAKQVPWPLRTVAHPDELSSVRLRQPTPLQSNYLESVREVLGIGQGEPIATLVIGVRLNEGDESRLKNLQTLLDFMRKHYGNAFDMLVVEQDVEPNPLLRDALPDDCRYKFLYNPNAYNRGWLYNVAAKHYSDLPVMGFLDTDIMPGENFFRCVLDCFHEFDAVSPNRNLFYSDDEQTDEFRATGRFDQFELTMASLANPTTLAGGMLLVNREKFLKIGGFEQYIGYGSEDRALDVTMFKLLPLDRIRMDSYAYFHQNHPKLKSEQTYFKDIYGHLVENYGCQYIPGLSPLDYIHKKCSHCDESVEAAAKLRLPYIGDPNLFRDNAHVTVNGLPGYVAAEGALVAPVKNKTPVYPPDFDGAKPYSDPELLTGKLRGAWAPAIDPSLEVDDTRQLQYFYNRFQGKRCFIIGNGPSLNNHDLSLLDGEYTFAVNSIFYMTRKNGFKPTFFVVEDSSVIKENTKAIVSYDAPYKFFPSIYQSLHPKSPGTYFFTLNRGFYDKRSPNYAIPRFSTDFSRVAYCGQSVTYINLQLAYYMGFTSVYLIGMDFDYVIPASHKRSGDVLLSDTDDPNHFHKDYFGKGKTWKDPKLDRVLMNYKMSKLTYECAGRGIYNATAGGKLDVFERVNFESLFGGLDPSFAKQPLDLKHPPKEWSVMKQTGKPAGISAAPLPPLSAAKPAALGTAVKPVASAPAAKLLVTDPIVKPAVPGSNAAIAKWPKEAASELAQILSRLMPAKEPTTPEDQLRMFARSTGEHVGLNSKVGKPFALTIKFRNLNSEADDFHFNTYGPPTPFVFGPIAASRVGPKSMRLVLGNADTGLASIDFKDQGEWVELAIVAHSDRTDVAINGCALPPQAALPEREISKVNLGCGHLHRSWAGRMSHFLIRRGSQLPELENFAAEASAPDTAFYFDGTKVVRS